MRWAMLMGACVAMAAMLAAAPAEAERYAATPHTPGAGRTSGNGVPHVYGGNTRPTPTHGHQGGFHSGLPASSHPFTQGR